MSINYRQIVDVSLRRQARPHGGHDDPQEESRQREQGSPGAPRGAGRIVMTEPASEPVQAVAATATAAAARKS